MSTSILEIWIATQFQLLRLKYASCKIYSCVWYKQAFVKGQEKTFSVSDNHTRPSMNSSSNITVTYRSDLEAVLLSVSLTINIALSLCGNSLLILAFIRNSRLRSSFANKLIMSLAMADFLTAALPLTYQLSTVINVHLISNEGLLCTIGGLTTYSFFFTSVFTLVMLSIDRFMALGYPLRYKRYVNFKVQVFMISYPWVHGFMFLILTGAFLEVEYNPTSYDCSLSWSDRPMSFTLTILMIHIGAPLILLIVLNTLTQCLVRAQNRRIMELDSKEINTTGSVFRDQKHQAHNRRGTIEMKLAKLSITIIFVFLACWTPYVVTRILAFLRFPLSSGIKSAGAWCVHVSLFANPMIYSSLRVDMRETMLSILKCHKS